MKGSRAVIMLLLSLMAGLAAVVLAARWLSEQASTSSQQLVVAGRDVNLGQPLSANMLELVPWPASAVPKGSFANLKDLEGRVLLTSLQRGEPILEGRLAPIGTKGGLSAVIPGGKRAITVKVNEVVGVAGFALPGNFVDVMVNAQDDNQKPISKIVLERILVLAVAQEASRDDTKPRVVNAVTLEVTPDQAEKLDLARSIGSLSLVLRNQIDQDSPATLGVRKNDLLGQTTAAPVDPPKIAAPAPAPARRVVRAPAPAPVAAPAPPPEERPSVEVIRGVQRASAQLCCRTERDNTRTGRRETT
jgi:pilus assembly protein CpaB